MPARKAIPLHSSSGAPKRPFCPTRQASQAQSAPLGKRQERVRGIAALDVYLLPGGEETKAKAEIYTSRANVPRDAHLSARALGSEPIISCLSKDTPNTPAPNPGSQGGSQQPSSRIRKALFARHSLSLPGGIPLS